MTIIKRPRIKMYRHRFLQPYIPILKLYFESAGMLLWIACSLCADPPASGGSEAGFSLFFILKVKKRGNRFSLFTLARLHIHVVDGKIKSNKDLILNMQIGKLVYSSASRSIGTGKNKIYQTIYMQRV